MEVRRIGKPHLKSIEIEFKWPINIFVALYRPQVYVYKHIYISMCVEFIAVYIIIANEQKVTLSFLKAVLPIRNNDFESTVDISNKHVVI